MAKRSFPTAMLGALVLGLLGVEGRASAGEPSRVKLVYARGAGAEKCPDEETLRNGVSGRLGRDPFDDHAERTVIARVSRARRTLRTRIEVRDASGELAGERELSSQGKDCAELAAATELAIAIAIDPLGAMEPKPPRPIVIKEEPPPAPPPPPPRVEVLVAAPAPPPPPPPRLHLSIYANGGAIVAFGAEPDLSQGGRVLVGVRHDAVSIGVDARMDAAASQAVGPGSIRASLVLGSVVPCVHHRVFAGCAILGVGALRSEGRSFEESRTSSTPVFVTGGRVALEIPLHGVLSLNFHGDVLVPLSQTVAQVNQSEVWRSPSVSGAVGFGLGVHIP
ncbi:hypothetical protein [Pendulispora albinea]|uniref:Uncharacterized protein n=1 Tax=Pendulispora albinea TaxID=2741071 RepID=A0ABZ2LSI5_9BACT